MSQRLTLEEASELNFTRSFRGSYDWDLWTDGDTHRLVIGEDFQCKLETFRVQWSRQCTERGLSSQTLLGDPEKEGQDGVIYVRAVDSRKRENMGCTTKKSDKKGDYKGTKSMPKAPAKPMGKPKSKPKRSSV